MNIEVGDIVKFSENGTVIFTWLEVLEINNENALCLHRRIDNQHDGDQRPTFTEPTEGFFPMSSLSIIRKK